MPSMTDRTPDQVWLEITRRIEEIDQLIQGLLRLREPVFSRISLSTPRLSPAELGFVRAAAWLYALYMEVATPDFRLLMDAVRSKLSDENPPVSQHPKTVQNLRTYLHHHLDPSSDRSWEIAEACGRWFDEACSTQTPTEDRHWAACLMALLEESEALLGAFVELLHSIQQDESREEICAEWHRRRDRHHAPHEYDALISIVAHDMGLDSLDPGRLRKRFYGRWDEDLRLLKDGYKFEVEARKLIEHALLHDLTLALPVTGDDVMELLDIPPGPEVKEALQLAAEVYAQGPCLRDELLSRLKAKWRPPDPGGRRRPVS